jgi:hypothetical protein
MSEMMVLDHSGDTKVMWDQDRTDEVKAAREMFQSLRKKNYLAFRVEGKEGNKGSQIDTFEPSLERIIMVPPFVGG